MSDDYTARQREYIDALGVDAHATAVEIIGALDAEVERLRGERKRLEEFRLCSAVREPALRAEIRVQMKAKMHEILRGSRLERALETLRERARAYLKLYDAAGTACDSDFALYAASVKSICDDALAACREATKKGGSDAK